MKKSYLIIKGVKIVKIGSVVKHKDFVLFKSGYELYLLAKKRNLKIFYLTKTKYKPSQVQYNLTNFITFKLGGHLYVFIVKFKNELPDKIILTQKIRING